MGNRVEGSNPSLSARFLLALGILLCALMLSSCEQRDSEEIKWQLPLSAPEDPHGASVSQDIPGWAVEAEGSAVIVLLEKSTARVHKSSIDIGDRILLFGLEIKVLGAAGGLRLKSGSYIDDENVDNPAAFVEVFEHGKELYRGWLYSEFPELFGPDSSSWKLWLQDLHLQKKADTSARSSVG
ncbi:MAG: DUF2155 domain-containing protein [Mariprofundaceae bacterium]